MKKVILTTNEDAIKEVKARAKTATDMLNLFIEKAEKEAKVKFSNEEKIQLKENGAEFLTDHFKQKFPIPGATDEFNLKAIDVDLDGLLKYNKKGVWQAYNFKLNESGTFELDGEPEQLDNCYTYVETEKQAEALKLAEDISELLNKATEKGYLEERLITNVKNLGDLLTFETVKEEIDGREVYKSVVIPNKGRISRFMK